MADNIQIEVVIAPDGTVQIKTSGLKGTSCVDETRDLERALGKTIHREKTSAYYQTTQNSYGKSRQR